ncbi:ATP synthase subunit I [Haemophilus influenzae]|uniref:ATP synthase subunit I n=1 Tax=Haemophilus influenzae TaxID=727 RepID=UPI000667B317|nr:ATP synthase subunit I [Haemophilus influenzae]AWP54446.1 ATP F0F1 synthase subunit I [Haemophilus influenzae]KMZ17523.1 ATP F0F1 synthase subunit I [Haemophilus influenzae]MCK8792125.1 ATP synthase subunit I [Haemophilus influenzae]MCK8846897.1 ATP synthase subunit I [Haemophilus influenzae]MCK9060230.1 ATP synthase subunit I [Haemophilus influenzae]
MSRILSHAKKNYRKAIIIESLLLVVFYLLIYGWQRQSAVDFGYGFLSAFLPFCTFIFIVFYRKQNFSTKLTALYKGEAIKFVLTIVFISISFKYFSVTNFIIFFSGFFIALMLNNLVPFLLRRI